MTESPSLAWHALAPETAATELRVTFSAGLHHAEVQARLAVHGSNRLAEKPARPACRKFLDQFRSLLILFLLGAAALAGAIGDLKDAIVIAVVVLQNATLGFFQEHRAEAALKIMLADGPGGHFWPCLS